MRIVFAVLGVLLVLTGVVLVMVPREDAARAQSRTINAQQVVSLAVRARDLADQVNGPLSIVFGLASLWYTRRRYVVERDSHGKDNTG